MLSGVYSIKIILMLTYSLTAFRVSVFKANNYGLNQKSKSYSTSVITKTYLRASTSTSSENSIRIAKEAPNLSQFEFKQLQLNNGILVTLVHDGLSEKSSCCLGVAAGAKHDPIDYPGLAHFTEHAVFMGSKKYPEENAYKDFINKNGGSYNGGTAMDTTTYMFTINAPAYHQALDIFSQFFKYPLFRYDSLCREVQAIDSEDSKNRILDHRRILQLLKDLLLPTTDYSKFSTGNIQTLAKANITSHTSILSQQMLNFHRTYYHADNMAVVLVGPQSLLELEELAVTHFANINMNPNDIDTDIIASNTTTVTSIMRSDSSNSVSTSQDILMQQTLYSMNDVIHSSEYSTSIKTHNNITNTLPTTTTTTTTTTTIEPTLSSISTSKSFIPFVKPLSTTTTTTTSNAATTNIADSSITGHVSERNQYEASYKKYTEQINQHSPYPFKQSNIVIRVKPVKDTYEMNVMWSIPPSRHLYRSDPCYLLTYLLTHKTTNHSIYSFLQQNSWGYSVSAGVRTEHDDFSIYQVSLRLSKEGLKHYEAIIALIYRNINIISTNVHKNIIYLNQLWKELKLSNDIDFRFQDRFTGYDLSQNLVQNMIYYPSEHIFSAGYILNDTYDVDMLHKVIQRIQPQNAVTLLKSSDYSWLPTDISDLNILDPNILHEIDTHQIDALFTRLGITLPSASQLPVSDVVEGASAIDNDGSEDIIDHMTNTASTSTSTTPQTDVFSINNDGTSSSADTRTILSAENSSNNKNNNNRPNRIEKYYGIPYRLDTPSDDIYTIWNTARNHPDQLQSLSLTPVTSMIQVEEKQDKMMITVNTATTTTTTTPTISTTASNICMNDLHRIYNYPIMLPKLNPYLSPDLLTREVKTPPILTLSKPNTTTITTTTSAAASSTTSAAATTTTSATASIDTISFGEDERDESVVTNVTLERFHSTYPTIIYTSNSPKTTTTLNTVNTNTTEVSDVQSSSAADIEYHVPHHSVWYSQDELFYLPKSVIVLFLSTPYCGDGSPINSALSSLYSQMMSDKYYPASIAGLVYSVSVGKRGFSFTVAGYSPKLPLLMQELLADWKNPEFWKNVPRNLFDSYKERLLQNSLSWKIERPDTLADGFFSYLLLEGSRTPEENIKYIQDMKYEDIIDRAQAISNYTKLTMYVHGDMSQQEVEKLYHTLITDDDKNKGSNTATRGINKKQLLEDMTRMINTKQNKLLSSDVSSTTSTPITSTNSNTYISSHNLTHSTMIIDTEKALTSQHAVNESIVQDMLTESLEWKARVRVLTEKHTRVLLPAFNPNDPNSALITYFQAEPRSAKNAAIILVINRLMSEPIFTDLRTKEQLGYIVSFSSSAYGRFPDVMRGFTVRVLSKRFHPIYMEKKLGDFLDRHRQVFQNMSQSEITKLSHTIIQSLRETPKACTDEADTFWNSIFENKDFDYITTVMTELMNLKVSDIIDFGMKYIFNANTRISLSLMVFGNQHVPLYNELIEKNKQSNYVLDYGDILTSEERTVTDIQLNNIDSNTIHIGTETTISASIVNQNELKSHDSTESCANATAEITSQFDSSSPTTSSTFCTSVDSMKYLRDSYPYYESNK